MLTIEDLRGLPKVALHDHLDGGLRPQTVVEHCRANGHELPTYDAEELGRWFFEAADSGSLERYLETFDHTIAAMQTAEQLARVAHEFVLDQAADGVVYAEARYAPEQHLRAGLSLAEVVQAVQEGLLSGMAEAEEAGQGIVVQQLVSSMRHVEPNTRIAELAVEFRDHGVCGFDIAGAEHGFPPTLFGPAFEYLRRENMFFTIHAGEAQGPESVWEAVQLCGANRIGHGVQVADDITVDEEGHAHLGRLAAYIRDARIPLEVAPTSNLQTGIADTIAEHPIGLLWRLGFNIGINCDNRLMSGTTMSNEFLLLVQQLGWGLADVEQATLNAMNAAFLPYDERLALIQGIIKPSFVAFRAGWDS